MNEFLRNAVNNQLDQEIFVRELYTTSEIYDLLGKKEWLEVFGPNRIAPKRNIRSFAFGGTIAAYVSDVDRVAEALAENPMRGKPTSGALELVRRKVGDYYSAKLSLYGNTKVADLLSRQEAAELIGGVTLERLYQRSDFRGGPLRTIKFGRTRAWFASSINTVSR